MEYADFEGKIPPGEYGGGALILWDYGEFINLRGDKEDLEKSYRQGKIEIELRGKKIVGGYQLIQLKDRDNWLLKKKNDNHENARINPIENQTLSVKSGKSLKELIKEGAG